jgi:dTDP-4-dehydrorhamnose reductase
LLSVLEREQPQAVFFCAYDKRDPSITVDAAVAAARLAAARSARFVFFSTDLVFGGERGGYAEDDPANPVMTYGRLKLAAEAGVREESPEALVLRPSLLVGESHGLLRPAYECEALSAGLPVDLFVDEWRSPVHVDDVARAAWDLASTEWAGLLHLGGPDRLTRFELGGLLCDQFGFDASLLRRAERPQDRPRDTSLDSRRAAALLGWAPRPLRAAAATASR